MQRLVVTEVQDRTNSAKQFLRTALGVFSFIYYFSALSDYIYSNAVCGPVQTTSSNPTPAYSDFVCPPQEVPSESASLDAEILNLTNSVAGVATTKDGVTYFVGSEGYCCNCQQGDTGNLEVAAGAFRNPDMSCSSDIYTDACHSLSLYTYLLSDSHSDVSSSVKTAIGDLLAPSGTSLTSLERSDVYSVSTGMWSYTAGVNVSMVVDDAWEVFSLNVSPEGSIVDTQEGIILRQIGDYVGTLAVPDLTSLYFVTPQSSTNASEGRYSRSIVVDKSFVGSDCNQMGVGYRAFQNHIKNDANCKADRRGSCLQNQHSILLSDDETRISQGVDPIYKVYVAEGQEAAKGLVLSNTDTTNVNPAVLYHQYGATHVTKMTLELKGDSVTQVVSPESALFAGAAISGDLITSGGSQALLEAIVENIGSTSGTFTVGVAQICTYVSPTSATTSQNATTTYYSGGTSSTSSLAEFLREEGGGTCVNMNDFMETASISRSVPSGQSQSINLTIRKSTTTSSNQVHFIELTLRSSTGVTVLDTYIVRAESVVVDDDSGSQGGDKNNTVPTVVTVATLVGTNGRAESSFNFGSFLLDLFSNLFFWLILVILIILFVCVSMYLGWGICCVKKCAELCKSSSKSKSKKKNKSGEKIRSKRSEDSGKSRKHRSKKYIDNQYSDQELETMNLIRSSRSNRRSNH